MYIIFSLLPLRFCNAVTFYSHGNKARVVVVVVVVVAIVQLWKFESADSPGSRKMVFSLYLLFKFSDIIENQFNIIN